MAKGLKAAYILGAGVFAFALFARCIGFSYIGLDDAAYTFRNPFVAGGFTVGNVVEAFTNLRHGGIWMPATYVSYMLDASLCRLTGIPLIGEMHLVNVMLHVVNFLLLWKFVEILLTRRFYPQPLSLSPQLSALAVLVAMVWAVHPLRVEPVAWIAARKELLWAFFTLCGLIFWIKALGVSHSPSQNSPLSSIFYQSSSVIFCALACLSKPTAMCFPFLALLVGLFICPPPLRSLRGIKAVPMAFMLFIATATACIAAYSQTHVAGQAATPIFTTPFAQRLIGALSAIGYYIRVTFWPSGLHIDCRAVSGLWPLDSCMNFIVLGVVFVTSLIVFVLSDFNRFRSAFLFSLFWFLLSLLPTLGVLGNFGMEAHADRFAYVPSMAFAFMLAWLGSSLPQRVVQRLCSIVVLLLSALAFIQLPHWRDDAFAHGRALACDPGHPRAMVHVADARCSRRHDFDGGIALYREALSRAGEVPPGGLDVADVKSRLAYALASRGRYEDFQEVKRLGADVLRDTRMDRRGMMLDALGTAFMMDCDFKRAALLFKASIDAPARFWPKASTKRKLEECMRR